MFTDTIQVITTTEPLPLAESDRSVETLLPREAATGFDSVVDLLRSDSSLNVQARGGEGIQADLSIRGTTFEQSLVLVNGFRVNDPETGHLNLDIPVPLDAITRVDVLHGSGSTFYGSDANGGAVNLLTEQPAPGLTLIARSGAGSYGSLENHLRAAYSKGSFAEQITASRDQSDGFMFDRNYASNAVASETWFKSAPGATDILLAGSDRPYGANNFYGYPSWERTKAWFASVQQQLGARTAASFGYTRHTDDFVLFVANPSAYENNHITTSYEGAVRRAEPLARSATLSYGLEEAGDTIDSFNLSGGARTAALGIHARNQGAGYANLTLPSLRRFSLSVGAREEVISSKGSVFSPDVAGAFTLTKTLRLRASASHGFRQPTYVDLFYSDPGTVGNAALRPETSWSYEGGADWMPTNGRFRLSTAGYRLNQANVIDYVKQLPLAAGEKWQAINIPTLDVSGAEASLRVRLNSTQQLELSYTANHSANLPAGYLSEYAFNFAAQNAVFAWTGQLPGTWGHEVTAHTQVEIVQKTTQTAYPLWDFDLTRNAGAIRPYLRLLNLANTGYTEIPFVPMQGRTIMGGIELNWSKR
jgi:iron complex outermembrane receptor protein